MVVFLRLRRLSGYRCCADLIGVMTGNALGHGVAQLPQCELGIFFGFRVRGNLVEILMQGHAQLHELFGQHTFEVILGFMRHAQPQRTGGFGNRCHVILRKCCQYVLRTRQQCPHFLQYVTALIFGKCEGLPVVFIGREGGG